jgi:hypothetical protein
MIWSVEGGNARKINLLNSFEYVPTGCTVRGSNLSGGKFIRTRPHRHWAPPSPLYNGYRVLLGGKAARA